MVDSDADAEEALWKKTKNVSYIGQFLKYRRNLERVHIYFNAVKTCVVKNHRLYSRFYLNFLKHSHGFISNLLNN